MSLIAWYPLDGDYNDYSGNNNHLINNFPNDIGFIDVDGILNKCINFSDMGYLISEKQFDFFGTRTYSFWMNPSESRVENSSIFYSVLGNIELRPTNIIVSASRYFVNGSEEVSTHGDASVSIIPINKWTHVAFTINSITNEICIYINGILDASHKRNIDTYKMTSHLNNKNLEKESIHISRYTSNKYIGKLNNVKVYNHILSPKEVEEDYMTCIFDLNINPYHTEFLSTNLPLFNDSTGFIGNIKSIDINVPEIISYPSIYGMYGANFNGDKFLYIDNDKLKIKKNITFNIWAYREDWTISGGGDTIQCFISNTEDGGSSFALEYYSTGIKFRYYTYIKSINNYVKVISPLFILDSGLHLFTVSDNIVDGVINFYIDGEKIYSYNYILAAINSTRGYVNTFIIIGSEPVGMANTNRDGTNDLYAIIYDFKIFASALTDKQIESLYRSRFTIDTESHEFMARHFIENSDIPTSNTLSLSDNSIIEKQEISEVGPTDGLLGWWLFEHSEYDFEGANNAIIINNDYKKVISDGIKYYKFLGTIDTSPVFKIDASLYNVLHYGHEDKSFTMSIWFKMDEANIENKFSSVFAKRGAISGIFLKGTNLESVISYSDSTSSGWMGSIICEKNTWYHYVLTYNGITRQVEIFSNNIKILIYTIPVGKYMRDFSMNNTNWFEICNGIYSSEWDILKGNIMDARLYGKALSEQEIDQLYKIHDNILINNEFIYGKIKEV